MQISEAELQRFRHIFQVGRRVYGWFAQSTFRCRLQYFSGGRNDFFTIINVTVSRCRFQYFHGGSNAKMLPTPTLPWRQQCEDPTAECLWLITLCT